MLTFVSKRTMWLGFVALMPQPIKGFGSFSIIFGLALFVSIGVDVAKAMRK